MPSWDFVRDNALPVLLYLVLPALTAAALTMAAAERLGGAKQAAAGAALGLCIGAGLGLMVYAVAPLMPKGYTLASFDFARSSQTASNALQLDQSTWGRLPWAILAALVIGRVAYLADVHSSDGWLLRGAAAVAIAWSLVPEAEREEIVWMTPALAAMIAALWIILDYLAGQPASSSVALAVILSLLTAAQIVGLHAHWLHTMDALAALAFAFLGLAIIAWRRGVEVGGAMPAVAVALPTLLLVAQRITDSKLHWSAFVLPACAPLVLAVTLPFPRWPKLRLHVVRLALVLAVLGAALVLAWLDEPLDFTGDGSE